jgi:hypothetical protein
MRKQKRLMLLAAETCGDYQSCYKLAELCEENIGGTSRTCNLLDPLELAYHFIHADSATIFAKRYGFDNADCVAEFFNHNCKFGFNQLNTMRLFEKNREWLQLYYQGFELEEISEMIDVSLRSLQIQLSRYQNMCDKHGILEGETIYL